MTPKEFVARWRNSDLNERQAYQAHFIALCELLEIDPPDGSGTDAHGRRFVFEESLKKEAGGQGYADVFYEGHFAIEYKAPDKYATLDDAYNQLKKYRQNLNNPPLLVVTDINRWEVHTNFNNAVHKVYTFTHEEIEHTRARRILREMFTNPNALHPDRTAEQITADAAVEFAKLTDEMRGGLIQVPPERVAHFLTKVVFCLFAEDAGLLPIASSGRGLFTEIIEETVQSPERFMRYMQDLFKAMADGGDVMLREVRWFNGKLFDDVTVEELTFEALQILQRAAKLDWSSVEPAIFGTLFERSLDPGKRAQLGAHYTSPDDIMLIVEPVLMAPLRREWAQTRAEAGKLRAQYDPAASKREQNRIRNRLDKLRGDMLNRLRTVKVLDPACGSGNFLYMALRALLDLEKAVITHPVWAGVGLTPTKPKVHPAQMYGIEKDPIAHDLATIVVWIGWIQWKINNGYPNYPEPVLKDLGENIKQMDAILAHDADGKPIEPEWEAVDVIVGNPPFLGGSLIRGELGEKYQHQIWELYKDRVPGFADLVCYWFERARAEIENGDVKRVGLLATNSIRGGANREVLKRIKDTGDIFMAWADREWILEGAAVRVSMVGFDDGSQEEKILDGQSANVINPDLTGAVDITVASILDENIDISFQGPSPKGAFDIEPELAKQILNTNNSSGKDNAAVVKPVINAADIMRSSRNYWTIDFGPHMSEEEAREYTAPYNHVREHVYPIRKNNNRKAYREKWWMYAEARVAMREALENLSRYVATPRVAKHRVFVWLDGNVLANDALIVFARDDDYFFGVLHSKLHEVWSLRMGTSLEDRPRYTPTTTFETFPFPYPPGSEPTNDPAVKRIAAAAQALHAARAAWLEPGAGVPEARLKQRTLTNLYNALAKWRDPAGYTGPKTQADADAFAPELDELHRELDTAVCAAYGWDKSVLDDDEAILRHLLALNLQRAQA